MGHPKTIVSDNNKTRVRVANGIETIIQVINMHINSKDVCFFGCWTLGALAEDNRKSQQYHNHHTHIKFS